VHQHWSFVIFSVFYLIRANLDYDEEMQWSVKNFNLKTRLFEAMVGMVDKMEQQQPPSPQVGVLQRPSFLLKDLRLPKKL